MKKKVVTSLLIILVLISMIGEAAAVAAPTIVSPKNGAQGVSCTPTLTWSRVTAAQRYDIQISRQSTFIQYVVNTTVTTTSYSVTTALQASTTYYWRVRSYSMGDNSSWATASFKTGTCGGGTGGGPSPPVLISPANNTTWTQSLYPTFQWQTVTGASSYTFQIATDSSFSNIIKQTTVYSTYYIIDTALTNCTSYYWRVRSIGDGDTVGSWSSYWKFTTQVAPSQPILTSPLSGAVLTMRRPTFTWESSTGATAYTLEINGSTYSVSTTTFTPYSNLSVGSHTWRVRATSCGGGQTSDWSPSRTFTINLDDVVLKLPANGATVTTQTPAFEWNQVEGATKYKLEVRKDSIDGARLFEVEVTGTSFTPTAIINPGTYYWRVMSYRNSIWTGSWSSQPFSFTVQTGGALGAPALTSPANGSTVDFPLTMTWGVVSGAYSYTLEYSRESSFTGAKSVTLFDTDYVISAPLEEGRWYWHVRANAREGGAGPWSTTRSFEVGLPVPQLLSPADNTSQSTSTINFDWTDVTGSQIGGELFDLDHYMLQYSTSNDFQSQNTISIDSQQGLPLRDSRYGPINLGDGTYYWRVKAIYIKYPDGTLREGSWSPASRFTISTGGVSIPSLVSPISGSVMKGTSITLVWNPVESTGITGYVLVYMMSSSTNPGNPSEWTQGSYTEVIIPGQSTSSYTITLQENTTQKPYYWWSIATVNSSGLKGAFPSPINFSIDNTPPNISVVELVQPVDTTLSTRIPTFTWKIPLTNYQEVATWTLEYASDIQLQQNRKTISGLTNLSTIISGSNASISYTLSGSQEMTNGTWYWHLSATDAAGNSSAYTGVKSFVVNAGTEPPSKVQLVSPPNGFENTPVRPTFSWLQVSGASSYQLQVDNNSNFSSPEIDQTGIATTSYMAPSDLSPDTYYWRVISNASNAEWSDKWSFTISGEEVPQVILTSPSSGAQNMSSTPLFQWQALEGATSYTLEVATSTTFTNLLVNKSGLTTTSWGTAADWESNDPSELPEGTYYWRVSSNIADSTSAIWNFTVEAEEAPGGTVTLTLNVSNLNGDPISGANITLRKDGDTKATATCDAQGKAVIEDLESGTYSMEVSAAGYSSYAESVNLSSNTTKNVTLYRGAVIHGYIYYDNTQNPASNVAVRIYESQTELQVVSDITDTSGYFVVDNISGDKSYYIVVENYEDQKKQGIVPVEAPTTANAITIIIKTEGEIIGVIQDEAGSPLPGAKVTLRDGNNQFVNSTSSNNIGSFTFKVTPGKYYVEVTLFNYEDYKGDLFTVEYQEVEDLGLITLISKTGSLVVTVQDVDGNVLDATITVTDEMGALVDSISVSGGTASADLIIGTYTLEADAEGYMSQVASNVVIESGTTVSQDFMLSPAPGSIKVYIADFEGVPLADAEVYLDGESVGLTDETGSLTISDVTAEDHEISVVKEGYADYKEIQTVNPEETLILELTMEETGFNPLYIGAVVVVIIIAGGAFFFLRSRGPGGGRPPGPKEKPSKGKERTRIPTGPRKEGLPRQSYRGR
ncbi:MAG: carboxypeptidase regulatory-like domain-containing protein [Theionarchaea archaeon]|nr:carboxypeptidase regulatory-like domain-containing protein [Theionarchaea archaeon]